jgi:hypothetical protein
MYTTFQNVDRDLVISIRISHFQFINIFTILLVVTGLYLIVGKVTLKISDKCSLEVILLSIELHLFNILLIIVSATDKKYLFKDSGRLFELVYTLSRVFNVGKIS